MRRRFLSSTRQDLPSFRAYAQGCLRTYSFLSFGTSCSAVRFFFCYLTQEGLNVRSRSDFPSSVGLDGPLLPFLLNPSLHDFSLVVLSGTVVCWLHFPSDLAVEVLAGHSGDDLPSVSPRMFFHWSFPVFAGFLFPPKRLFSIPGVSLLSLTSPAVAGIRPPFRSSSLFERGLQPSPPFSPHIRGGPISRHIMLETDRFPPWLGGWGFFGRASLQLFFSWRVLARVGVICTSPPPSVAVGDPARPLRFLPLVLSSCQNQ